MAHNYIEEYEKQYTIDKVNDKVGWYSNSWSNELAKRIQDLEYKIHSCIYKICIGYGVLPSRTSIKKYQQMVLNGEMTFTNAMKLYKKNLYGN